MIVHQSRLRKAIDHSNESRLSSMVEYLRSVVLRAPEQGERFHAIFVDSHGRYLCDATMGQGEIGSLRLRMRDLFSKALTSGANAIIIAHNHPSGDCRPSEDDIESTLRLAAVSEALDIELLDHLIFTHSTVYSMRAGGIL